MKLPNLFFADKSNSWLRFRYGRLSVDSDDHNFNKKCVIDDNDDDDVLVEYKSDTKSSDKINGVQESQYFDANGNEVNGKNQNANDDCCGCECEEVVVVDQITGGKIELDGSQQKDETVMKKLMTLAMEDYGEFAYQLSLPTCDDVRKHSWDEDANNSS